MKFLTHKLGYHAIIGGILGITGIFGVFSAASVGINLIFDGLAGNLITTTFPVSFIGGGNSFAGSLIFNDTTTVSKIITFTGGTSVTCGKQMHGYYFNAARGAGLLPLSTQTQMNDGVSVEGGLYTSCDNGPLGLDFIGMLTYTKNGAPLGRVVFGVATDVSTNTSSGIYQAGALSLVNGRLNGRFFDTMFGIGDMSSSDIGLGTIGSVSNMIGLFSNIYIQGHIGIGQSVDTRERGVLAVNFANSKTLLTSSDEILSSDVINTVSRNAGKRCRGTTLYYAYDINSSQNIGTNKFVCINLKYETFTIHGGNIEFFYNKDIVFLNGNVKLDPSIYGSTSFPHKYLSIYIPDGNLIFESNIDTDNLTNLDNNGFPSTTTSTKGVYLVGNFVVNGLVVGSPYEHDGTMAGMDFSTGLPYNHNNNNHSYMSIPYRTFIHGKLVSLNTFTTVSKQREKLLRNLLEDRSPTYDQIATTNPYFPNEKWNASMGDVFAWRCASTTTSTTIGPQEQGFGATPIGIFHPNTLSAVKSIPCPRSNIGNNHSLVIIEKSLNSSFFLK